MFRTELRPLPIHVLTLWAPAWLHLQMVPLSRWLSWNSVLRERPVLTGRVLLSAEQTLEFTFSVQTLSTSPKDRCSQNAALTAPWPWTSKPQGCKTTASAVEAVPGLWCLVMAAQTKGQPVCFLSLPLQCSGSAGPSNIKGMGEHLPLGPVASLPGLPNTEGKTRPLRAASAFAAVGQEVGIGSKTQFFRLDSTQPHVGGLGFVGASYRQLLEDSPTRPDEAPSPGEQGPWWGSEMREWVKHLPVPGVQ